MAKIDEIREILTSLRVGFSVIVGLLVVIKRRFNLRCKIYRETLKRNKGGRIMSTVALSTVIIIAIASFTYSMYQIINYKTAQ